MYVLGLLAKRCIPSCVVDTKADIAADSWGSSWIAERAAGAVLGYSNAEGSRRVPRYKEIVRIEL
jgi:hypothetical protein